MSTFTIRATLINPDHHERSVDADLLVDTMAMYSLLPAEIVELLDLTAFKARVVETIQAPDAIYQAKRDPSRRACARKYAHVPGVGNELTLLVFAGTGDGYVATSYFAAYRLRPLGGQIWPSR